MQLLILYVTNHFDQYLLDFKCPYATAKLIEPHEKYPSRLNQKVDLPMSKYHMMIELNLKLNLAFNLY